MDDIDRNMRVGRDEPARRDACKLTGVRRVSQAQRPHHQKRGNHKDACDKGKPPRDPRRNQAREHGKHDGSRRGPEQGVKRERRQGLAGEQRKPRPRKAATRTGHARHKANGAPDAARREHACRHEQDGSDRTKLAHRSPQNKPTARLRRRRRFWSSAGIKGRHNSRSVDVGRWCRMTVRHGSAGARRLAHPATPKARTRDAWRRATRA